MLGDEVGRHRPVLLERSLGVWNGLLTSVANQREGKPREDESKEDDDHRFFFLT